MRILIPAPHWKVTESACDLLFATITLFGHNGVLRGDEIFSKIRVGDVTWDHGSAIRSFKVHIGRPDQPGKTAKDGGGFIVHIVDYKGASAYKYLVPGLIFMVSGPGLSATSSPTQQSPAKTRQLYFSSINASVRSGISADSTLCLLLLVRTRLCTLFIPSGQVEQRNCSCPELLWR